MVDDLKARPPSLRTVKQVDREKWLVDVLLDAIQFYVFAEAKPEDVEKLIESIGEGSCCDTEVAAIVQIPRWMSAAEAQAAVDRAFAAHREQAAAEVREGRWQPIETVERANGRRLILAWDDCPSLPYHWEVGRWSSNLGWVNTYGKAFSGEPTHWMEPEPPVRTTLQKDS